MGWIRRRQAEDFAAVVLFPKFFFVPRCKKSRREERSPALPSWGAKSAGDMKVGVPPSSLSRGKNDSSLSKWALARRARATVAEWGAVPEPSWIMKRLEPGHTHQQTLQHLSPSSRCRSSPLIIQKQKKQGRSRRKQEKK